MGSMPVYLHKAHLYKQEEEAHTSQNEGINRLYMNTVSLPDKMDELRELSDTNNPHLIGIPETWISSQMWVRS